MPGAEDVRRLFAYIVDNLSLADDLIDIDLTATASDRADSMAKDRSVATTRARERAKTMAEPFEKGLLLAWDRRQHGEATVHFNDSLPAENKMADALIGYLVSFGLAGSRAEQLGPGNYSYVISVDWPTLKQIAQQAGVDLELGDGISP